jgi:hypothetical protein
MSASAHGTPMPSPVPGSPSISLLNALEAAIDAAGELRNIIAHDGEPAIALACAGRLEACVELADGQARFDGVNLLSLSRACSDVRNLVIELGPRPGKVIVRNSVLAQADPIAAALRDQYERALHLAQFSHTVQAASVHQRPIVNVAPSACRLLAIAARILPAVDRTRFAEEFRAELWEIARAGAGRRHQVRYALRQATRTVTLRSAVLAPRRRRASP